MIIFGESLANSPQTSNLSIWQVSFKRYLPEWRLISTLIYLYTCKFGLASPNSYWPVHFNFHLPWLLSSTNECEHREPSLTNI